MTVLVAGIGFALGQSAVDVALLIDRLAIWVIVDLIAATLLSNTRVHVSFLKQ